MRIKMHLSTFSQINLERCESPAGFNHKLADWTVSDWFTATVGEFGEAANIAKKLNRVRDGIPGNGELTAEQLKEMLGRELADTFIYLDLLAQSAGVDLESAVIDTFNKKSDHLGCHIRV
jgi:NTP pyrophosphatase (non-canonical NTP hydrolase)